MTGEQFSRTAALLGQEGVERLHRASVAVFGLGGVGSYVAEVLARSGVGRLVLVDADTVSLSNINRQLVALHSTVGQPKVQVAARRIADIYPACTVEAYPLFYDENTAPQLSLTGLDYVVDAIDSVTSKILLTEQCLQAQVPLISCMGTGNKLDPMRFEVADISRTSVCPLARVMRTELRKRGIHHLKVVYSKEVPAVAGQRVPASLPFVPAAAGLLLAGEVIKQLAGSLTKGCEQAL